MGNTFELNDDFQNRLTYPFIFSFLASWVFWNWGIVICLFSHDSKGIENFFPSVWQYIKTRTTWELSLFGPLISAITYTIVYPPLIKAAITLFNAEVVRIRKEVNLQVLNKEIEKFLEQKNKLQKH